jgi:starch-binding outer membrane protein, SusD/RagB family
MHTTKKHRVLAGIARFAAACMLVAVATTACDTEGLLEVDDPDVTRPEALFDSTNVAAVRAYGVGEFSIAFGGSSTTPGVVTAGGLLADEFFHSGTFQQNREIDKRRIGNQNATLNTVFSNLQQARRATELATRSFEQLRPNTAELAELQNLAGYTYLLFAETFCSGVPFSEQVDGRFEYGPRQTTAEILTRASQRFDAAATTAGAATGTAASNQQNLSRLGRARIAMNQNNYAAAVALVSGIPTNWSYQLEYSDNTTRQNNGVFGITQTRKEYGLASLEGGNGIEYRLNPEDPRVPWSIDGGAADALIRQYTPRKYDSRNAPIALASGLEARLIEAEAALDRGNSNAYLPILNALRAPAGLSDLSDPGSADERVDQFFRERAFWLFGSGQRLGAMRRLVRQYGRAADDVFPAGDYTRLGTDEILRPDAVGYGPDVNLPLPIQEENNPLPESAICIDRSA